MNTVTVFVAGFLLDLIYTQWLLHASEGHRYRAAGASMAIGALSLLGVSSVVVDHWAAIPYLAGLGLGTFVGVRK
jgi:hypothetical protein